MRLILTVASLISAAIAACIGFEIIHVQQGKTLLLEVGWLGWAICLLAAASLPWGQRLERWFE